MKAARFEPEAQVELRAAAVWYKERSPDVARRFLAEARALVRVVAQKPLRFPVLVTRDPHPEVRRALLSGFPYALVFVVHDDRVCVVAVAHQHQAPGYWLYRLTPKR